MKSLIAIGADQLSEFIRAGFILLTIVSSMIRLIVGQAAKAWSNSPRALKGTGLTLVLLVVFAYPTLVGMLVAIRISCLLVELFHEDFKQLKLTAYRKARDHGFEEPTVTLVRKEEFL